MIVQQGAHDAPPAPVLVECQWHPCLRAQGLFGLDADIRPEVLGSDHARVDRRAGAEGRRNILQCRGHLDNAATPVYTFGIPHPQGEGYERSERCDAGSEAAVDQPPQDD